MDFTGLVNIIQTTPILLKYEKGEAGTRAWTSNPGEYNNAFDGKYGGMWRARGRIPSKVCGLTFTSYGFDVSSYYKKRRR